MTDPIGDFRASLRKGSGRAAILLTADPSNAAFRAALLDACTTNLLYDVQCEDGRAPYLHRLIAITGDASFYWNELLRTLQTTDINSAARDVIQYFELLCLLAADRDVADGAPLRAFLDSEVARKADFSGIGCCCGESLIALGGVPTLIDLIDIYRARLVENIEHDGGWTFKTWIRAATDGKGAASETALAAARAETPALDELMILHDACKARDANSLQARNAEAADIDYFAAKAMVDAGRAFPYAWINEASEDDLRLAAQDLLREGDEKRKRQYLRLFAKREFPFDPAPLFPLLDGLDREAVLASRCLGRLKSDEIRQKAMTMLEQPECLAMAIRLLRSNWRAGDIARIESAFGTGERDDDDWHDIGSAVLDLIDAGVVAPGEMRETMMLLYETEPCSICRASIVGHLSETNLAPDWMKRECVFDADSGTAATFAPTG